MTRRRLARIIVGCTVAIILLIVLVSFKPWERTHTLSVSVSPSGVGSVFPSGGEYESGAQVTLLASPARGYTFDHWQGSASGTSSTVTISMNSDQEVTAVFVPQNRLTTGSTVGGGVTAPGEGTFSYDAGTVVDLAARAEEGYRFVDWTGNVGTVADINAATTSITMDRNHSISANFERIPEYELTICSTKGGSVTTPGEGTFTFYDGEVVSLEAIAETGYRFVAWTGDVDTIANPDTASTTIITDSDRSITATFEPRPPAVEYKITGTASSVSVTLTNATGGMEQFTSVRVPHTYTFETFPDRFLYISAQNMGPSGSVTVTIYLHGRAVATATSSGAYVIASADYYRP